MSNLRLVDNNATTTVGATLLAGGTTLTVNAGGGALFSTVAAPNIMMLTLSGTNGVEIVQVTTHTVAADTFTIVRAQEGTTAVQYEVGEVVELRLTKGYLDDLVQADNGGNTKGTLAVNIQPGRALNSNVASGNNSIAIGNSSTSSGVKAISLGDSSSSGGLASIAIGDSSSSTEVSSIAIGRYSTAGSGYGNDNTISIGKSSSSTNSSTIAIGTSSSSGSDFGANGIAIGSNAIARGVESIAIGNSTTTPSFTNQVIAIGINIDVGSGSANSLSLGETIVNTGSANSIAIGRNSNVTSSASSLSIGNSATVSSAANSTAIGVSAKNTVANSTVISNPIIIRDNGVIPSINNAPTRTRYGASSEVILCTEVIDTKVVADIGIDLPADFFITEAGVISVDVTGLTVQPSVAFGTTAVLADIVPATLTTALSVAGKRERFTSPLLTDTAITTSLFARITTASTATTHGCRFYVKGMMIKSSATNG